MQITRKDLDALNSTLTITLEQNDFAEKVLNVLNDYRKNANIPGFRKGHVPMGMVKKQYGKSIMIDEVNKLLQDSIEYYGRLQEYRFDDTHKIVLLNYEISCFSESYTC